MYTYVDAYAYMHVNNYMGNNNYYYLIVCCILIKNVIDVVLACFIIIIIIIVTINNNRIIIIIIIMYIHTMYLHVRAGLGARGAGRRLAAGGTVATYIIIV